MRIVVRPEWTQVHLQRTDRSAAVVDLTTTSDERALVPVARAGDAANSNVRARPGASHQRWTGRLTAK